MELTKSGKRKLAAQFAANNFIYTEEDWTTDSYTAVKAHIEPNSPRVYIDPRKPRLQYILDQLPALQLVEMTHSDDEYVTMSNAKTTAKLNRKYYDNIVTALGGYAWPRLTADFGPVAWVDDSNQVVALLMPLQRG